MSALRIAVGYLYPDVMSGYGDSGNLAAIRRRCCWRGIDTDITELGAGDLIPSGLDLIMIGGGSDTQQRLVAPDLYRVKGAAIRDALADGAAALAVGGGYELFGRFCQPERGAEFRRYRGVRLLDDPAQRDCGPGRATDRGPEG